MYVLRGCMCKHWHFCITCIFYSLYAVTILYIRIHFMNNAINKSTCNFFYSYFHLYGNCLIHTFTPFFSLPPFLPFSPSFVHFLPARFFPLRIWPMPMSLNALSHLHEGTGKLRNTWADTVRYLRVGYGELWQMSLTLCPTDLQNTKEPGLISC